VNVRVAVFECRLEDERGGVAAPHRRAVVGACITTCAVDVGDIGVLFRR
jgi:hypothetical protein